jgi:hypothetical protein
LASLVGVVSRFMNRSTSSSIRGTDDESLSSPSGLTFSSREFRYVETAFTAARLPSTGKLERTG